MARRNDGSGDQSGTGKHGGTGTHGGTGEDTGTGECSSTDRGSGSGRGTPGVGRCARLGTLAALALALVLPIALAAPAAGSAGAESVVVESEVGPGAGSAVSGGTGGQEARGLALPGPKAGVAALSHRHYYSTWRDARTYWSQESRYPTGGWLWAGRHYFFCQVEGEPHSDGEGAYSTWWALTDDDTGNRDVFVSATAFRDSETWQPIEGLPRC